MKKIIFCLGLLLLGPALSADSFAPYQRGDILLGGAVKWAFPGLGTDWGEVNVDQQTLDIAHDAKLGTMGAGAELQALYFVSAHVALGASVGTEFFSQDHASGLEKDVSTHISNYMLAGRVYLTPASPWRFYIPLALGVANTHITVDMEPNVLFKYTGFATHAGLGVEHAVSEHWLVGGEVRYNTNRFHDSRYTSHHEKVYVYPRANYISFVVRAARRF